LDGLQTYRPTTGVIDVRWLLDHLHLPVIDVRSPGEFERGHIPGAISVPLFDDDQRAVVGTLYKQQGREPAIQRGLDIATAKSDNLATEIARHVGDADFILHCWRGGMRSRGVAWLCDQRGLKPKLLEGGYKSFRRAAHRNFEQHRDIILLAGKTGTGKTLLLEKLAEAGQQTIDLEGLAVHRGSAFGGIPDTPQPTTEHFENLLFLQWSRLDARRPVWIEGENQSIGKVRVPVPVFRQMTNSPIVVVEVNRQKRVDFLLDQYSYLTDEHLTESVHRIQKRLGGLRLTQAIKAIESGDRRSFVEITLEYYDKTYGKALENKQELGIFTVEMSKPADSDVVGTLIDLANSLDQNRRPRLSKSLP